MHSDLQNESKIKKKSSLCNPSTTVVEKMDLGQKGLFAVTGGPKLGLSFQVKPNEKVIIGSTPEATVQIQGRGISRNHCAIYWSGDTLVLEDFQSSNGTLLNKQKVNKPAKIKSGDTISIGVTTVIKCN